MHVLIVHSSALSRTVLARTLRAEYDSVTVTETGNDGEAARLVSAQSFDIIFAEDLAILQSHPVFRAALRSSTGNVRAPLVAITGRDDARQQAALRGVDVQRFAHPPFAAADMRQLVASLFDPVANRRQERYFIPGCTVRLATEVGGVFGEVLNISKGGFAARFVRGSSPFDFLAEANVTLFFPQEFAAAPIIGIAGRLVRLKVVDRGEDGYASELLVAIQMRYATVAARDLLAGALDSFAEAARRDAGAFS
ncbi:MAG: hypothetical protein HYV63_33380 [Candidatus Schekmanbacteria bacterium]|nr:hypothetical protein [Candidatus Schekmanbacteria bacterium]